MDRCSQEMGLVVTVTLDSKLGLRLTSSAAREYAVRESMSIDCLQEV